jgi:hypothetical protein
LDDVEARHNVVWCAGVDGVVRGEREGDDDGKGVGRGVGDGKRVGDRNRIGMMTRNRDDRKKGGRRGIWVTTVRGMECPGRVDWVKKLHKRDSRNGNRIKLYAR